MRRVVWTTTGLLALVVAGFAWTQRQTESPPPSPGAPAAPTAMFGDALPADSMFGPDAVCDEYELEQSGAWRCDSVLVNSSHAPVYPAARYAGPCAHLKVVERSWVCLGNTPAPGVPQATS